MSYWDAARLARDPDCRERIAACAAGEGLEETPTVWAERYQWQLAAAPGWAEAYASALESGVERPGKDESVITDAMILAAVQQLLHPES